MRLIGGDPDGAAVSPSEALGGAASASAASAARCWTRRRRTTPERPSAAAPGPSASVPDASAPPRPRPPRAAFEMGGLGDHTVLGFGDGLRRCARFGPQFFGMVEAGDMGIGARPAGGGEGEERRPGGRSRGFGGGSASSRWEEASNSGCGGAGRLNGGGRDSRGMFQFRTHGTTATIAAMTDGPDKSNPWQKSTTVHRQGSHLLDSWSRLRGLSAPGAARPVASLHGFQATADSPGPGGPRHGWGHGGGHERNTLGRVAAAQDPAGGAGGGAGRKSSGRCASPRQGWRWRAPLPRCPRPWRVQKRRRHVPARLADPGRGGVLPAPRRCSFRACSIG